MHSITATFFYKQTQTTNVNISDTQDTQLDTFVFRNNKATYTFGQYLFIEKTFYGLYKVPSYREYNLYKSFVLFSTISTLKSCEIHFTTSILDSFAVYFATHLNFKTAHSVIYVRPNALGFFSYYKKSFITRLVEEVESCLVVSKTIRLDYQRKLQNRRQSNFVLNGTYSNFSFFNTLFFRNNPLTFKTKNKKLFKKKLRSKKAIRKLIEAEISEDSHIVYTKRFSNQKQKRRFFASYKRVQLRFKAPNFVPTTLFPKKIWFRNQILKILARQKKSRKFSKDTNKSPVIYSKKSAPFSTPLVPASLKFKLFPSDYGEITLNTNLFAQFKIIVSFITNSRFSFYQVNALSLTRFAFDNQTKMAKDYIKSRNKLSQFYLNSIERERISRYRYVGTHIKDLIRICFFSIYLKKADFLAAFFAFTISKLPRNRKELKYVQFLIKLLKMFASRNKTILGVRIRFQGRLNR